MVADTVAKQQVALTNWVACNDYLRAAKEIEAQLLLETEKLGKARLQYLLRIHARYNRLRANRERSELLKLSGQ